MGLNWSVTLHQAGEACQCQTLLLIGLIGKLQRKWGDSIGPMLATPMELLYTSYIPYTDLLYTLYRTLIYLICRSSIIFFNFYQFFGGLNYHCVRKGVKAEAVTENDLTIPDSYW
jgi:hypothetical protein